MLKSIQLVTHEKANSVIDQFVSVYGVDPCGIYCLFTGKRIGTIDSDEFIALIESLDLDIESAADDLAMRLFASLRPSMRWNKMRSESLDLMRKQVPVETLAYLMNRLFASKVSGGFVTEHMERIKLYDHLAGFASDERFPELLHRMLEIDSKLNLLSLTPKFICRDILAQDSVESILTLTLAWYESSCTIWHNEQLQARYSAANPLAKRAFFSSFMESAPKTENASRRTQKQRDSDFLSELFHEIESASRVVLDPVAPTPVVKKPLAKPTLSKSAREEIIASMPSVKAPMKFGVKS